MKSYVAWIDDIHVLTVIVNNIDVLLKSNKGTPIIYWEAREQYFHTKVERKLNSSTIRITLDDELPMGETLTLLWGELKIPVYPRNIVRTEWFDHRYSALDSDLGARCDVSTTTFSIWVPTATSVKVVIDKQLFLLNKQANGIWSLKINGDWHGYSYEYEVVISGEITRVNDPYAKTMLPNSKKGIIIDFSRTDQSEIQRPQLDRLQDAIIYELHVRDATIQDDSGVKNQGKFLGLTEPFTTNANGYSTALSYIKELGCTHVQLLPINDFGRVDELKPNETYNWGYDPLYFQVPEGSYSVLPDQPMARINECKKMIQSFHQEGISVILDVVFNHVFIREESAFEKLVPRYYFRYHEDGSISNGTGVGNDIATERQMVRKFILDTIDFWLQEYTIDGFRFDLMGSIDTETMSQIQERCKKEAIPVMLLGEGWDLPTALHSDKKATSSKSQHLKGIRYFNDYFRDSLKGNLFEKSDTGYINGNGRFIERLPNLVSGSILEAYGAPFVSDIKQTINYVECHDNHTLWDRLLLTNREASELDRKKMHQLATGITLVSQGVPFIHAGQEWFRTKQGVENSYTSNDSINQLDWNKRELENETIEFVKILISLRKENTVFRLTSKHEIKRRFHVLETPSPVFGFTLLGDGVDFSIYINPTNNHHPVRLPSTGKWKVAVSNDFKKDKVEQEVIGEYTFIEPYELVVLQKLRKPVSKEVALEYAGDSYSNSSE